MIKVRKGGIYQNIESSEFGIYQTNGWEKVINQSLPKLEDVKPETVEDIIVPKSKRRKH